MTAFRAVRDFTVSIGEETLADTRARLAATRWIADPCVGDPAWGASLPFARTLCEHWLNRFDWRALEARINRQPQVLAEVDGLLIHAIHRRSSRADAVPLLLIHGWPSSFLEFLDICDALAEPQGNGPAFHVIVPSLPGYGFSSTRPGTSPRRIAGLFAELMRQFGHERFLIQGGNWGSSIGTEMARDYPERVIGLHLNSVNGSAPPADAGIVLTGEDQVLADRYATLLSAPHFNLFAQAPLATAHAMNDSPAGLAAWLGQWLRDWADADLPGNPGLSLDWIVGTAALYWFTGTAGTSAMLYREAVLDPAPERFVAVPTAVAQFARELVLIPQPWAERHYNVVQWNRFEHGGHYAAVEAPDALVGDLRAFARMLT